MIDRRGEPQAVIMSLDDDIDAIAPEPDWLAKIGDQGTAFVNTPE